MDTETAKAINNLSKRLNSVERKIEAFFLMKHEENQNAIYTTDSGVVGIAEIVNSHDRAIAELAEIISNGMDGE